MEQLVRLAISSAACGGVEVVAECEGVVIGRQGYDVPAGDSTVDFFIRELPERRTVIFKMRDSVHEIAITPPRHWRVHVVQLSHHDVGYTDLASSVWKEQARHLEEALAYAEETEGYPDDATFRIVIEQGWSLDSFLHSASEAAAAKMIRLLQSGRFEMTALYGNMVSELCGHASLMRAAYHSAALSRRYGIPVVSAEHNDVPGISWGLSEALSDIGVKIFCPGLPLYYGWGDLKFQSFWNVETMFGHDAPGAFWWETPTGRRLLFWCNNSGCGGGSHGALPQLEGELERMASSGYPFSVVRFPVGGGYRDNAPYIKAYADTIRAWNARWEYPRLICSTNAKFYDDVSKVIPATLPVWRGELPGQDYPNGATSTAVATAANRRTHVALPDAEQLAIAASLHTGYRYPAERIGEAYAESLLHDEHTWGYHFPAGPATRAAECEKALRAFRAEAFAAEVRDKAMAHIADAVKLESGALFLVVFNPTSWALTAPLSVPMREMDGTGSEMRPKDGALVGALLGTRWHAYPDMAYLQEGFDIIDVATGESVAYDVAEVKDAFDPVDFAPQRVGLGNGTRRYGFFESPGIVRHDIRFVAKDVPAHGYRAYRLKKGTPPVMARHDRGSPNIIENKHYRIVADGTTMRLVSVYDKEAGRELADPDGGDFYRLIVRGKTPATEHGETRLAVTTRRCNTYSEMRIDGSAHGHPVVRHHIRLHDGIKRIAFETSLFKDPTPLLNVHLAFPMKAENPHFRYEGALCVMEPVKDYLPNAYSDLITVQSWVRIQDGDYHILWHSHDAPMAGFGTVWPGYTSPAHRCAIDESFRHAPQTEKEYHRNGWIFSQLCDNNFGTNFAVSQSGVMVFRYCLTTGKGVVGDADAAKWGWQAASSGTTLFTDKASPGGTLPPCGQFLACDNPATPVLHWKAAEDGRGVIVRLWNMSDRPQTVTLAFTGFTVTAATFTNMVEVDASGEGIILDRGRCAFPITPNAIVTVRALIGA